MRRRGYTTRNLMYHLIKASTAYIPAFAYPDPSSPSEESEEFDSRFYKPKYSHRYYELRDKYFAEGAQEFERLKSEVCGRKCYGLQINVSGPADVPSYNSIRAKTDDDSQTKIG